MDWNEREIQKMYNADISRDTTIYIGIRVVVLLFGILLWFSARAPNDTGRFGTVIVTFRRIIAVCMVLFCITGIIAAMFINQNMPQQTIQRIEAVNSYTCGHSTCYKMILANGPSFQISKEISNQLHPKTCVKVQFYKERFFLSSPTFIEHIDFADSTLCASGETGA